MSSTYYWRRRKQVQGPFDAERMKEFYDNGSLNATHEISTDGQAWFPAGELIGSWAEDDPGDLPPTTTPDDEWHYELDGAANGPVSFYQLQQLLATGQLTAQTRVWKEGLPEWQAASAVPGLIPTPGGDEPPGGGKTGGEISEDQSTNPAIFSALGRSRPWATFLAIVLLIIGALGVIAGIVIFIKGAKYENVFLIGYGIGSIIGSGTTVTVAIILLQFSSLANAAQIQRTDKTLIAALDGLRRYFLVQGMVVLLGLSMVLLLVILQAALS